VIDSLDEQASGDGSAVVILYCDYHEQHEQTTTNMVGAILKQLVVKDDRILGFVREAFLKAKTECGGQRLCLSDLVGLLKKSMVSLPQVFICIDALDEFVPKELPKLLDSLKDIVQELPNMRVFLTGRPHVEPQITRHFTQAVMIPISPKPHDIESYLGRKLVMDTEPHVMDDDLRSDITRTIHDSLSESFVEIPILHHTSMIIHILTIPCRFLLVSLSIDAILEEVTVSDRRNKLNQMSKGDGLGDVYTKTLERMKAQKGPRPEFGMKALMWVAYSERPLQASELCYALGVKTGSAYSDLDLGDVPKIQTLLGRCLGLITLEKSSGTVRLVHFTLRDHLSNTPTIFESPHSMIAEICLTYLHFKSIRGLPSSPLPTLSTIPLLYYASCYWERHARRGVTHNVKQLVLGLLDGFGQQISSRILLIYGEYPIELGRWWPSDLEWDRFKGFTCLHWTASLGMLEMTSALLEMKEWDLNATDATGNAAIAWAARGGHMDILKKLLERNDIDPDNADNDGRTPLLWAVSGGHEEAVKLLLERKDAAFSLPLNGRIPVASSTKPSALLQPRSKWICSFWSLPPQPGALASDTPLIIQILIDCLVISVSLCLLIFLSWIIPSSSAIMLSFHRLTPEWGW